MYRASEEGSMRKRHWAGACIVVAALATFAWSRAERPPFEEQVARAALAEEIRADPARCPLADDAIAAAPSWLLAACADGGTGWYEAARRYGDTAARVYLVYGQDPALADVFDRLGHPVIPVIAYFVDNGSTEYRLRETIGGGLSRFWNGGAEGPAFAELSPEQYGLIAIEELRRRGHEMLSEFEVVDGVAVRRPLTRALLGAKNVFFGGVSDLERVVARGERLPSWSEIGWAALDAAIVVGGIGAAAKVLRVSRVPVQAAGRGTRVATLRAAGSGAARSLATVGRAAGVAAAVAIPYVVVTRPRLVASAAGWLAERAGLPAWLGVFALCLAVLACASALIRFVFGPAWRVLRLPVKAAFLAFSATRAVALPRPSR